MHRKSSPFSSPTILSIPCQDGEGIERWIDTPGSLVEEEEKHDGTIPWNGAAAPPPRRSRAHSRLTERRDPSLMDLCQFQTYTGEGGRACKVLRASAHPGPERRPPSPQSMDAFVAASFQARARDESPAWNTSAWLAARVTPPACPADLSRSVRWSDQILPPRLRAGLNCSDSARRRNGANNQPCPRVDLGCSAAIMRTTTDTMVLDDTAGSSESRQYSCAGLRCMLPRRPSGLVPPCADGEPSMDVIV